MDIREARRLFVGLNDKVFLDSACVGLAPITAHQAINKFLDIAVHCPAKNVSDHHIAMDEMKQEALIFGTQLINSHIDNLSLIESTTHGLNIAVNSIPFDSSDEVIICDTEYLQVAIPFMKRHEKQELKVVPLKAPYGHISMAHFERCITKNTKAIVISSVQWCTGQRIFTRELGKLCQQQGIWLVVDGVQELGALTFDPEARYCDFYIAGGHKWLNAPYGCGLMYMSKRAQELEPPGYGYLNLPAPEKGWGNYFQEPSQTPFREYRFPRVAKSFGIGGTGNYPGAIGLGQSIKLVNDLGTHNVEHRVLALSSLVRAELQKLGARIVSPDDPESRSGITMFRLFDTYEQDQKALDYLLEQRIFLSIRYTNGHGGIRVSTHYFNNEEDIARLCHAIKNII